MELGSARELGVGRTRIGADLGFDSMFVPAPMFDRFGADMGFDSMFDPEGSHLCSNGLDRTWEGN